MTELHRFRAMGCDVAVLGCEPRAVESIFARWERVFSRFLPGSELTRVNRSPAAVVRTSPLFAHALSAALDAAVATDRLVDPTLGAALESAGYDRDFDRLSDDPRPPGPPAPSRLAELRLAGAILSRPPGLLLDLNGVVKALAVDEVVEALRTPGFVSAGGDLAVRGPVDVGLPGGGAIRVRRGGLATSGAASRRWRRGDVMQHHLIDPRSGRPADSPWQQVTVSGASCLAADVAAKAAFLLGDDGPDWLDERSLPGRFVSTDGVVVLNEAWRRGARESVCT